MMALIQFIRTRAVFIGRIESLRDEEEGEQEGLVELGDHQEHGTLQGQPRQGEDIRPVPR